ncbi:hypothetical protein DNTS_030382 [Danionella cerebrum]|uniref:Tumor necrosis factor receptor superfamily member 1A n=1 Tax=Danionella cerebrum TaxID=2873325 RepID=A0A553QWF1_9TELE|nr:hypothetical protein DNTS_030382 [Danionella translucida]TRY94302.1 hypothetical protein DNTS_030382 [Danionella translucida]
MDGCDTIFVDDDKRRSGRESKEKGKNELSSLEFCWMFLDSVPLVGGRSAPVPPTAAMRKPKLCVWFLLILIRALHVIADVPHSGGRVGKESCSENEFWSKRGFCCDKCHAGFKLKEECPGPKMRSDCVKCDEGTYLDIVNYIPNCFMCQECRRNSKELTPCRANADRVCRCDQGFYKKTLEDNLQWECLRCKKCGPGQIETQQCSAEKNTECRCLENHYPVNKSSCEPCVKCLPNKCDHLCASPTTQHPTGSPDALGQILTLIITMSAESKSESVPLTRQSETEGNLPDCVPREIKLHEFFYYVLDQVPVSKFKELMRRLSVSEQDIERAEHDHRICKDAHYQMLRVWSDACGGNSVVSFEHIQMMIERLRDMCLVNCAENIESTFLSQDASVS